jgi:hypothetical protein
VELIGFESSPYWAVVDPENGKPLRKQGPTFDVDTFLRFLRGE